MELILGHPKWKPSECKQNQHKMWLDFVFVASMLFSQACFDCLSQNIWHNGCWQKTGQATDRQTFVSRVSINIETFSCINPGSTTKYQHQLISKSGVNKQYGGKHHCRVFSK